MQLRYVNSLLPPSSSIAKVTALAWSPNCRRLAAVTLSRIVSLFDENGELKDKFSTKRADPKGSRFYIVTGMVFSPDSTRLAIAQSDEVIFVYKIGTEWGDKKTICNKLQQMASITSLIWPCVHKYEILFGLTDGKVKVGQLRSNRTATAYTHGAGSAVVSLASSPAGSDCLAGHLDGSIYRVILENGATSISAVKFANYGDIPTALAWGKSIVAAGPDCKVIFYDMNGAITQKFDYSGDQAAQDFLTARFNPSGETLVFGCFNGFRIFSESTEPGSWEDKGETHVENLYSISALDWKPDGSQLAIGGLCGNVDIYDACLRQYRYQGKFEFTYITKSQIIVRRLSTGNRTVLRSHHGWEITRINIYHDQYLIAHTPKTLLMGNLESCKLSEVPWCGSGSEKFLLDNPSVCMVHNAGELSLVEYGCNEVLGTCRTEHLSPYLISIRLNELAVPSDISNSEEEVKKIAYLIDLQTIRILDLVRGVTAGTLIHDFKVDWLELNPLATHLLFRDKKQQLHLFNIANQERTTLLNFCSYVQWVPGRDVVVAQNRENLYVWYSIKDPEQATVFPIKGEVEGIERTDSRTEVIVNEGITVVSYVLDEALIEFGSALENFEYNRAISILEPLQLTPETEAMWKQLSDTALLHRELFVAEHCFAALGDVAKARFMHKVNKSTQAIIRDTGTDGKDYYLVRAKLALLQHQWKVAETLLLEHGYVAETIQMYTECHRF